jgi:hypothetical protein
MVDVESLLIKLIKNKALESNLIFVFEKQGSFFVHTAISQEFAECVKTPKSQLIHKNLLEIHSEEVALTRRNLYEKSWGGQEVYYQVEYSLNSNCPIYVVLSPIFVDGRVVKVIGFGVPYEEIPARLREIIA